MSWPIIAGGSGGGGGGGGATGVSVSGTTSEIATLGTEDMDLDVHGLEVGDLVGCTLTRTAGDSTSVSLQILDGDGNSLGWPIGTVFSGVNASSPVDGPRSQINGYYHYFPMCLRSSTGKAHFRIYNKDGINTGTFSLSIVARPVTTA